MRDPSKPRPGPSSWTIHSPALKTTPTADSLAPVLSSVTISTLGDEGSILYSSHPPRPESPMMWNRQTGQISQPQPRKPARTPRAPTSPPPPPPPSRITKPPPPPPPRTHSTSSVATPPPRPQPTSRPSTPILTHVKLRRRTEKITTVNIEDPSDPLTLLRLATLNSLRTWYYQSSSRCSTIPLPSDSPPASRPATPSPSPSPEKKPHVVTIEGQEPREDEEDWMSLKRRKLKFIAEERIRRKILDPLEPLRAHSREKSRNERGRVRSGENERGRSTSTTPVRLIGRGAR